MKDENKIITSYKSGLSMSAVGKLYGITGSAVFRILHKHNIEVRTNGGIYKLDEKSICKDYQDGKSTSVIAKKNKVNVHTITNILEKYGIKRNNIYHNLDLINDYWEEIDKYDKAYFLGFLIADGNVIGNSTKLQLSKKDEHILKTFANKTKNSNKITESKKGLVGLSVKRKKWVEDLKQYGVVPNKTSIAYLPKLDENMMPHLIRGLIDGDGWISYKSHSIGFCGNETIVNQVRDFIVQKLDVYKVKVLHTGTNLWMINWASIKDIRKIGEYIYQNKYDCYLKRKYDNFMNIINANTEVNSEIAKRL